MSEDLRSAVDGLRSDMAGHQRQFSSNVTDAQNHTLAAETIERVEREMADAGPGPVAEPTPVALPPMSREFDDRKYTLARAPEAAGSVRQATSAEHDFLRHALPRMNLLMTKRETGPLGQPSWSQRVEAVTALRTHATSLQKAGQLELAESMDRRFLFEFMRLLEESSAPFGDWKADPAARITVSG